MQHDQHYRDWLRWRDELADVAVVRMFERVNDDGSRRIF